MCVHVLTFVRAPTRVRACLHVLLTTEITLKPLEWSDT